jgi:protein tyrosine/serine phosphatase
MHRILRYTGALMLAFVLVTGAYFEYNFKTGNFHTITTGEAYRSAQLNKDQLEYYTNKYKIMSILNLRGKEPESKWYKDELAISDARHIAHYDIAMSALSEPAPKDIEEMINIFRSAPRPILIHCLGGADRSGLAAAVWKKVIDKEPKARAARQLSLRYGHLPFGKTKVMDKGFEKL